MPTSNRPPSSLASQIAAVPRRHDNDNPLWQGPCGAGPLGGITQSMLVRFLSCRERFRLKYVLGLEPPDMWVKTTGYGNMWHVCEEAHARNPQGDEPVPIGGIGERPAWLSELTSHTDQQLIKYPMQRDDIGKWYHVCLVQFPEYVKYWSEHPDVKNRTPLMQEQVFDVPYTLPSGRVVRLRGKFDSVDLIDGGVYLQENKTKGDIDKLQVERQLKFDLQTMLYLTSLTEAENTGVPYIDIGLKTDIKGVRYNVVRRPLSGGVGSIRPHAAKFTKTKSTPAETDEEFYERLRRDYIADDPGYWFFRVRSEVSAEDIQVFRDTCLDPLLEHLCEWYEYVTGIEFKVDSLWRGRTKNTPNRLHYRTPFGVWSALEEGGATEYDHFLESGSEAGLRRVETLFTELQ